MRMVNASGIGTYIRNLVPRLMSLCPEFDFCLIGDLDEMNESIAGTNTRVRLVTCKSPIYSLAEQFTFVKSVPDNTDLLWVPHFNIPIRYRRRLIVTVHDLLHLARPRYSRGWYKRRAAKMLFAAIRDRADMILFDSKFTRSEFRSIVGQESNGSDILYCGVDPSWFSIRSAVSPHPQPYIVHTGNVKPHKNLRRLLEVFIDCKACAEYDLVMVGKDNGFATGDRQVKKLAEQIRHRIRFTGYIEFENLQQYVSHAECLVFPSLYEGFGLPPLEAMAAGTPSLVGNTTSLPEVCGDAVLYCDPYDEKDFSEKLETIITDRQLRQTLISKGKLQAERYSWDRSAEQLAATIRGLLES